MRLIVMEVKEIKLLPSSVPLELTDGKSYMSQMLQRGN